jgi:biopolymer transport protein ExbB
VIRGFSESSITMPSTVDPKSPLTRLALSLAALAAAVAVLWALPQLEVVHAQESVESGQNAKADAAPAEAPPDGADQPPAEDRSINVFRLAIAGGIFMIPIAAMSILAVTVTFERMLALRKGRVLPGRLVRGLDELAARPRFDTNEAYRLCETYPSAAARVVAAMLVRAGRPLGEIESATAQASQREADRLYANVRWLNLAASLATLLGLIGTIQGMILAFHRLTLMDAATDRTTSLADGIYVALVTTFAGLAVAIPTLLVSHLFENRILGRFRQIDELVFDLLPLVAAPHAPLPAPPPAPAVSENGARQRANGDLSGPGVSGTLVEQANQA